MTEIQRAKHEVSMRFWKETIMKRTASGLTIAAFCQKHASFSTKYTINSSRPQLSLDGLVC